MSKPMEAVYGQFGLRVRRIREALGIDQASLAKRVGLTRTSIVNIEASRQRVLLADVEKFASALGVSEKHLMKGIWW
jgi:transcriptional regulator with XRE-family HTH domain